MLSYFFDFREVEDEAEMTFEGFTKSALDPAMLAELDAFSGGLG